MNLHSRGLALIKEKLSKEEDLLHYVWKIVLDKNLVTC
jgi:hypothetical protein